MRVLFFGTYDARSHPRVRVLLEGFQDHGDEVSTCNEPLALDTAARVKALRSPWLLPLVGLRLLAAWWRLWRRARRLPRPDVIVVGYLGHLDVHLARRLWRRTPVVLDHLVSLHDTALDRGLASPRMRRLLRRIDDAALRAADLVCVDTPEHHEMLPADARERGLVVPVGAPRAWSDVVRPDAGSAALRVVFFGLFTPLQGAPVIGEAIGLLAGEEVTFTMVGRGQDLDATRAAAEPNRSVTWVPWIEADDLPTLVAHHDVCLGIFGEGHKAARVVPNKVFQGAAAGCAIVTSDTEPQRRAFGEAAVFVTPGEPKVLAEALRSLHADRERLDGLRATARGRIDERFRPAIIVEELRDRVMTLELR